MPADWKNTKVYEANRKELLKLWIKRFRENKVYIVLGANRGGTSFIAKALHDQGVDMGNKYMLGPNVFNPLGHFEDARFNTLDAQILSAANGSWASPPSEDNIRVHASKREGEIKDLISKASSEYWGWKDPRSALTIDNYLPHIDGDVYLVCVFRKPNRAGESIKRRGNGGGGTELAKEYYKRIIKTIKKFTGLTNE